MFVIIGPCPCACLIFCFSTSRSVLFEFLLSAILTESTSSQVPRLFFSSWLHHCVYHPLVHIPSSVHSGFAKKAEFLVPASSTATLTTLLYHQTTKKPISATMKTTTFLVYLTYIAATIAVAIPSPAAAEAGITVEEQTATTAVERRDGSDAQIPVNGNSGGDNSDDDDGEAGSCFCAGTSICCRKDGEVDCGYGLCGVWI